MRRGQRDQDLSDLVAVLDGDFVRWAHRLPLDQRAALRRYQNADHGEINALLRNPTGADGYRIEDLRRLRTTIAGVRAAINGARLQRRGALYRGIEYKHSRTVGHFDVADPSTLIGQRIESAGFFSTSLSEAEAWGIARPRGIVVEIHAPAGTPAAWMRLVGKPQFRDEYEVLLDDGTAIIVTGVTVRDGVTIIRGRRVS